MEISIGLYPNASAREVVASAVLAEASGYASVWLADSHLLWREPWVLLGAIAERTRRVRLATCVTNPLTRHPTVTAAAVATLGELSRGRALLGISVGDSALRAMGLRPATIARLTASIRDIRALLAGGPVAAGGSEPAALAYAGGAPVPVYVAATGPRMLALAGAIADGVILMNGVAPDLVEAACAIVARGARAAGRDPAAVRKVVWAACHASDDEPERSIALCKYNVARAVLRDVPGANDARTREVAERVRARYDYAHHGDAGADFAAIVPDDLVPRFAFAGKPADVRAAIADVAAIGVDEVALAVPLAPDAAGRDAVVRLLAPGGAPID